MDLIGGGIGLLLGAGQAIWGASEKKKYKRQIEALDANRPKYDINQEEYDIQNLAESRANQGMGAGARTVLQNNADRNLATLSNAALMGGADGNAIGAIAGNTQNAYNQNALYDDQVRLQNLSNLQNVWARQSANKDKQWQINEQNPWSDKMTGLSQQLQGANNMFNSGLNMAGSGLMQMFSGGSSGKSSQGGGSQSGGGSAEGSPYLGGGSDYSGNPSTGGSDLGQGGYSPFMGNSNSSMVGVSPQYPTNDQAVTFLGNNTNTWNP